MRLRRARTRPRRWFHLPNSGPHPLQPPLSPISNRAPLVAGDDLPDIAVTAQPQPPSWLLMPLAPMSRSNASSINYQRYLIIDEQQ